ncbi:ABC transporter permease [Apilactobacillus apisilvae]|uniref:ABC transporter permease n=1 Tax=Apilactobacillus apisilvae TaxID=2923364 RepID=A0ABY4PGE0_9LACO|nr:ABC transporter permease [Apilactobacillus apisilvae]UQS84667.1 ABC transporter permease [Apilactobacillus apisilvae]
MRKFMTIVEDTYLKQVKSKSFIFLVLLPIIGILFTLGIGYFAANNASSSDNQDKIALLGNSDVKKSLIKLDNDSINHSINDESKAKSSVKSGDIYGYVKITNKNGKLVANYVGNSDIDDDVKTDLIQVLKNSQSKMNLKNSQLSAEQIKNLSVQPVFSSKVKANKVADDKNNSNTAKVGSLTTLIYVMYFFLLMYSGVTASVIAQEKGSKIIEVIFSSTTASKYFVGKIIGIILTLLTQVLCYAILLTIGYQVLANMNSMKSVFNEIQPVLHDVFTNFMNFNLIFIILGLALGIILSAVSGALVSRKEDAGKAAQPIVLLTLIMFLASNALQNNSNGIISKVLSYFPLSSMYFMPIRAINGQVGILEQLISLIILIAFIVGLTYWISKVYKGLMLRSDDSGWIRSFMNGIKYR